MNAWKTVIVEPYSRVSLRDEQLVVEEEETRKSIPVDQIRQVLFSTDKGSVTLPLLTRLAEQGTAVLFCDSAYKPISTLVAFAGNHFEGAGRLMDQAAWTVRRKNAVWNQIVRMKIRQQIALLERLELKTPPNMSCFLKEVSEGDARNREGVTAKLYYNKLFGDGFVRHMPDVLNAALNYGYTILCSSISRLIALHGYSTALGIHHRGRTNPFNLSCDVMEPFRPFVDEIVYLNQTEAFDYDYKKKLLALPYSICEFDSRKSTVEDAMELLVLDVIHAMAEPRSKLKEVRFVK